MQIENSPYLFGKMWTSLWIFLGIPVLCLQGPHPQRDTTADRNTAWKAQLKNWTDSLGHQIFSFANVATRYQEMQERFQKSDATIRKINLEQLVEDMANKTQSVLSGRVDALKKIMDTAEEQAKGHFEEKENDTDADSTIYSEIYWNAKKIGAYKSGENNDDGEEGKGKSKKDPLRRSVALKEDMWFETDVAYNFSSIHVPTSIYDQRKDILEGIDWTSNMDDVFRDNFYKDPTLLWQYFASADGFMRQYPASIWPNTNSDKHNPDIYDCRTRPWYTAAANSPKNIVILQDVSGSMTGLRREIAKHVIYTILDTLTDNDYVSVLNFTETTDPLVPCFKDDLVQANLENIREFKVALEQDRTAGMANFVEALTRAFKILKQHQNSSLIQSANCNEAIMLITDGAPYYYDEIFQQFNSENRTRVFTYLVGREVTDTNEVLWMACRNKGYFVHVTTLGEVQEQVLKYLTVMSKPMVMAQTHSVSWSLVYPDVVDISETDWLWDEEIRRKQGERSERYREFLLRVSNKTGGYDFYAPAADGMPQKRKRGWSNIRISGQRVAEFLDYGMTNPSEDDLRELLAKEERDQKRKQLGLLPESTSDHPSTKHLPTLDHHHTHNHHMPRAEAITQKKIQERQKAKEAKLKKEEADRARWGPFRRFKFMVTASMPVFDQRNSTTVTKMHFNETDSYVESFKESIAIFLGVVGTDIPIKEFQKIASPFKLGVNGYAFAISENGYILFHPEWRPLTQEILKPNYNAVDLTEIELFDSDEYDGGVSRNQARELLDMRHSMLFLPEGEVRTLKLPVRVPQDDFRRVRVRKQEYAFAKIKGTPYTLAVTIPQGSKYQLNGQLELRLEGKRTPDLDVTTYFEKHDEPRKWLLHPEWTYCEYIHREGENENMTTKFTKEETLIHFLRKIKKAPNGWAWKNIMNATRSAHVRGNTYRLPDIYSCDKDLVQSLVFDAKITGPFNLKKYEELKQSESAFAQIYINATEKVVQAYGAVVAFIATRSGLTRWIDYSKSYEGHRSNTYVHFSKTNPYAAEELFYKRAVDRYEVDQGMSYVVSVPFDAGTRNDSLVTAARSIFVTKRVVETNEYKSVPVAVTGVQFEHEKMAERFREITNNTLPICNNTAICQPCGSEFSNCFVLDESGFIIVADTHKYSGRFLGEVFGIMMQELVDIEVYKRTRVVDYQAICHHLLNRPGIASILLNPFVTFKWLIRWMLGRLAWFALQVNLHNFIHPDYASVLADSAYPVSDDQPMEEDNPNWHPFLELAPVNKTRLRPCHKEYNLYRYGGTYDKKLYYQGFLSGILSDCDSAGNNGDYAVHLINRTNLILLVVQGTCNGRENKMRISVKPSEVVYELEEELENMTVHNDVVAQVCRVPILNLERKKPNKPCYSFDKRREMPDGKFCGVVKDDGNLKMKIATRDGEMKYLPENTNFRKVIRNEGFKD